jgi:UDP-2,4-diacetamido-2,4,6-trideoxy-beta-L-altropyranose hydrolase
MSLFIRVDADSKIGTGHIMRCIALAQAWHDQGEEVTFIGRCKGDFLKEKIQREGFGFIALDRSCPDPDDLKKTLSILKKGSSFKKSMLVIDGYHFTSDYLKTLHNEGYWTLVIDDMNHLPHYSADIILNQNIHAADLKYRCDEATILLMGTQYVLLRREFLKYRKFRRQIQNRAKNILVTLGGADPGNVTLKVIEALKVLDESDIISKIIIGPANPHKIALQRAIDTVNFKAELLINPPNIPELMIFADLAVSAGGITCWELMFMGVPSIVGRIADIEDLLIRRLSGLDLFVDAGWFSKITESYLANLLNNYIHDTKWRLDMSTQGPEIIDGFGCNRVLEMMRASMA